MKTAKDRFHEVMDSLGLSDYKVYTSIEGITKNMISKLRQGHTEEVSVKILMPFCEAYPEVNANYILTGKGDMFLDTDKSTSENIASQSQKMYKDTITSKDKEIANLKAEIERMKSEIDKLIGQNEIMREQLGLSERKASTKSA
jgi:DNA-binding Xre family transcriptional regulator